MGKIKLTGEMVQRIEAALDERKRQRRAEPQTTDTERRSRSDRRRDSAAEAGPGATPPVEG